MPKQGTRAEVNTFVKGLITEASPLNFPANASFDEINFELNRDGTRNRRLGLDLEDSFRYIAAPSLDGVADTYASETFIWENVNEDVDTEFLVVQSGNQLRFFDLNTVPLSYTSLGTLVLIFPQDVKYSFASIGGKLIIAGGGKQIGTVAWEDPFFIVSYVSLKVRDQWGVECSEVALEEDSSFQPASLNFEHNYNLQNQSWGIPRKDADGVLQNPISLFAAELFKRPSNSQVVWSGMAYQPVVGAANPYERLFTNLLQERIGADVIAAKGYFIIDLLDRGQSRMTAKTVNYNKYIEMWPADEDLETPLPIDSHTSGATAVTEYAGRIFYSGFNGDLVDGDRRSPSLQDYVVFSQLVRSDPDITKCYQEGDPTSRESNEVVDTDGGFISISGAKKILAMRVLGTRLIIFATNGVWAISGGGNSGFSAVNYKVDKLSTYGCSSASSIAAQGTALVYWGRDAIYAVAPNQYNDLVVDDLTAGTIQTLYNEIPIEAKEGAKGVYDLFEKKIRWMYRSGGLFTANSVCKELVFDTVLKAFYQYEISQIPGYTHEVVDIVYASNPYVKLQHLVLYSSSDGIKFTFATFRNEQFRDWYSANGVGTDAKAYLVTGAITAGDNAIEKQAPYLIMHMRKTDLRVDGEGNLTNTSSCLMRAQWNWATSEISKKFGSLQEVYKYRLPVFGIPDYDNGLATVISKNKLRGRGKALSLYFETSPDKDCNILGWSLTLNGNAVA